MTDPAATAPHAAPETPAVERSAYWGFAVVGVCLLVSAFTGGVGYTSFSLFAEQWASDLGVARSEIMIAITLATVAMGVLSPPAGRALDRRPPRLIIGAGVLACVTGLFLLGRTTEVWQILAVYATLIPLSLVLAGVMPAQVLGARWFPEKRGLILGVTSSGLAIGGVVFPPLIAQLIKMTDWRTTTDILAAGALAVIVPLTLLVLRNPTTAATQQQAGPGRVLADDYTVREILGQRDFWILTALYLSVFVAVTGFMTNIVHYAAEKGLGLAAAAALLSVLSLVTTGGKFCWGYLADKYEHRRLLAIAAVGVCAGFLALAFVTGAAALTVTVAAIGAMSAAFLPVVTASLSHRFKGSFGRAYGLLAFGLPLAAVGAPLVARMRELLGGFTLVMLLLAALVAVGGGALVFLQGSRAPDDSAAGA